MDKPCLFASLEKLVADYLSVTEIQSLERAYAVAHQAHQTQLRSTGEAYITHPLAVAQILAHHRLDEPTLSAALLHDVIEDTALTYSDLKAQFGETIARLVDGVSKLDYIHFKTKQEAESENLKKMLIAMTHDVRVILIKLADRLHNMRTLTVLPSHKQTRIARETLEIYSVIAGRLGMFDIKMELESLSFFHLYPRRFRLLNELIQQEQTQTHRITALLSEQLLPSFLKHQIPLQLISTPLTPYTLYRQHRKYRSGFKALCKIRRYKMIVPNASNCYLALGILHTAYKPRWHRFKDYIAIPKANGYQALHTGLLGPSGVLMDLQIRSEEMELFANSGITSYWTHKTAQIELDPRVQKHTKKWQLLLKELYKQSEQEASYFLEELKAELCPTEMYVFTPKGEIVELPLGATALDFAYAVHTAIGNTCVAALINRIPAPISTRLENGQTVEVITQSTARPKATWLNFVTSSRARLKIRQALKHNYQHASVELGLQLLKREAERIPFTFHPESLLPFLEEFGATSIEDLLLRVSRGDISHIHLIQCLRAGAHATDLAQVSEACVVKGVASPLLHFSECCYPICGDPIVGCLVPSKGCLVHREACPAIRNYEPTQQNFIPLEWEPSNGHHLFFAPLVGELVLNPSHLHSLLDTLEALQTPVETLTINKTTRASYQLEIILKVQDRNQLAHILRTLRLMPELLVIKRRKALFQNG